MLSNFDDEIALVDLKNRSDRDVKAGLATFSWDAVVNIMMRHHQRQDKDGSCFMPVKMKPVDEWVLSKPRRGHNPSYRNDANVQSISFAVLDLDKEGAREKAEKIFDNFEYVVYSTHSYTKNSQHKFRIVLKLDKPIQAEDWPDAFQNLISDIDADKVCGNLSRIFYFPSASIDSGITPYSHHNPGRALTLEDINNLGVNRKKSDVRKSYINNGVRNHSEEPRVLRHFTGGVVEQSDGYRNKIDYSYEGLCKRHEKNIRDLISDDSRHNFALSVIAREVGIAGNRINLLSTVQFLYRAAEQYSSKALSEGNTAEELPEIIESAFIKYAPDVISGKNAMVDDFDSYVSKIIASAEEISITGRWNFQDNAANKAREINKKLIKEVDSDVDYSYQGIRERNRGLIKALITNNDPFEFAKNVIKNEFNSFGKSANINYIGQFIFYCYTGYLTKCKGQVNPGPGLNDIAKTLSENSESLVPDNCHIEEKKMAMFIRGSVAVSNKTAQGDQQWNFGADYSPQKARELDR